MFLIHLVDSYSKINFGFWNASIFGSSYLKNKHDIQSELWVCDQKMEEGLSVMLPVIYIPKRSQQQDSFIAFLAERGLWKESVIIITHGCWRMPTHLGYWAGKAGYHWIYTPHGMLEPWSLAHKKWKKWLYFHCFEKRMLQHTSLVRAVGTVEKKNLEDLLKRKITLIENGVPDADLTAKVGGKTVFLFMARLHFKKGITPLVKAWYKMMRDEVNVQLVFAGPDEGELPLIKPYLGGNIEYVGPVYGSAKKRLLQKANYFILPSLSEGFPVSVLEAMSYGCIPVISEACNFPAVFQQMLGYKVGTTVSEIRSILSELKMKSFDVAMSEKNALFIQNNYSEPVIAKTLLSTYQTLFN